MINEDYLSCSEYSGQTVHPSEANFVAFYHETSQLHFFALLDSTGEVLLKSEGYPQPASRENGIQSVIKNRTNREFFSVKEEDGQYFLSLRAANHREIARSCSFSSEAEANEFLDYATGDKVRSVVAATAAAAPAERADNKVDDDYMICREYAGHEGVDENGLVKFTHSNGQHYFAWYDDNGDVLMRSEGYPTTAARDNGYASVLKNRDLEGRYATLEKMGRYFTILKAGNHQEIARSCPHASEAAALAIYPGARAGSNRASIVTDGAAATVLATAVAAMTHTEGATHSEAAEVTHTEAAAHVETTTDAVAHVESAAHTEGVVAEHVESVAHTHTESAAAHVESAAGPADVEDDYLPCREYEGRNINDKQNNVSMFKHENGQFYFAVYNKDGGVRLRSEGFRTSQERDKELSGVLKNLNNEEMYSTMKRGAYSIQILKDKTGREVGRSCLQKEHSMATIIETPVVETVVAAPVVEAKAETHTVEVASFAAAATAVAAAAVVETPAVEEVIAAPVVEAIVETPSVQTVVETPVVEHHEIISPDVEDDYLPCTAYEGHAVTDKDHNIALFTHAADGQYYFAVYNADGGVRLRSEGFRTTADRDVELASVVKNLNNGAMYETLRRGAYYMSVLKDEAGHEVGRSCLHKDAPAVVVETPKVAVAAAAVAAVAATAAVVPPKVEAHVEKDVEDDYLVCGEYENRAVNDKQNNVAMFKHSNGQFYFAIYNADGSVRLRSEGFRTSQDRDKELSGALKNLNNPDFYTVIKKGSHYIQVLKDKTGREVGRSCLHKDEPKPVSAPSVAPVAVAAATAAAAAVVTKMTETTKVEVEKPVVVASQKVATPIVESVAPTVTETVEEAATGGFKWWWLLPLLLPVLWWFFKDGCNKPEVVAPAVPTVTMETPKVDTVKTAPAPVVAAKGCAACAEEASSDPIFTSICVNPKKLNRLGSNPEFGNSHALSPEEFYEKLKKAYADNDVDKVFLDKVYKSMGYDGFKDAKADQFSAVILPVGTSGRLGYSKAHKTGCYTLPDDEYHRKAFHITAANGCDLHFMKTCGNHFFFCKK